MIQKTARPKIGVFSGYDPRPWVMAECADTDITVIEKLINRIEAGNRYQIVWPGRARGGHDKLCYTPKLCESYAAELAEAGVDALLNIHPTWTFPQTSQKVVSSYEQKMRAKDATFRARLLLASIQDTTVPGMVSGMATGGSFTQNGQSFIHVYGDFESNTTISEIERGLDFLVERARQGDAVREIINNLHKLHAIEFGSFSLQMPTTRMNQEELTQRFGITSESLDQQVFLDRAFVMFDWEGEPGRSKIIKVKDSRVEKALQRNYDTNPSKFGVLPGRAVSRDKYALQLAMYFATNDIVTERGAGAVTIKCQDECSGKFATCCMATSFLGNDTDPLGDKKAMVPTSCETDLPTMYSQYLLKEIAGTPAGFGDFRYVKTDEKSGETLLAIVNCGQHPVYFAGRENDSLTKKEAQVDYPGQEHFYAAGGAAVRMRTGGGQDVTVARFGSENGRLYITATVMKTTDVPLSRHDSYNKSWPILEGIVPVNDQTLGRRWPSNHLAFVYGNHLPAVAEAAERMNIGYTIWTRDGAEYSRPS